MRLVMMGTGPFAVPTFRALYGTSHQVVALVTQPLRTAHGKALPPSPTRAVANEHGTPIIDFENINTPESRAALAALAPDLFVVADYGQILSPEVLSIARLGGLNLHGSLLPKYRGAAPINWAIYHGEPVTGVTALHVTPAVDAGPCLAQASTPIDPDETAVELEHRLAELGAPLIVETIDQLSRGQTSPIPQDPALATKARRLRKTDGAIDWSRSALQIKNQIRALEPWPKTYTFWHRQHGAPLRLIPDRVQVVDMPAHRPAGTVIAAHDDELVVAARVQALRIERIQPAGKRVLTAAEFLRGYPVQPGDLFGPNPAT
jgi:methionyl-tRNA formyltransferase